MKNETEGQLLRIFIGESDRHEGKPLHSWLLLKARDMGLAGATVVRGLEGFGASSRIHSANILRLSEDLPVVLEVVDREERIREFLEVVDGVVTGGLATIERVQIHFYRGNEQE
jgi:PII-like signaling protein